MEMFRLDGQRALVTGANTGIGQAIAVALAAAGAEVICAARRTPNETLALMGGRGRALLIDLSDPMAARGGRGKVVNIASLLSFQGGIRVASYTASKHGIAGVTKVLANEWAGRGINVNAIAPGYVETNNTEALRADPDRSAAILARIPAGRWGRPEDIAGAAVFLSSRAADYVHGAILNVDGGWMAR